MNKLRNYNINNTIYEVVPMEQRVADRRPQESSREFVYRFLKSSIMEVSLPPGAALSEKDIAALLGVSRTPVREAFIQLSQEGLLDIMPQKGTYVSLIDLDSVAESKFLRETMEEAVMKEACRDYPPAMLFELQSNVTLQELCLNEKNYIRFFELDEALHRSIFEGCRKGRIWHMMQLMHGHYNRVRRLNIAGGYDVHTVLRQHQDMVQAISEKNPARGVKVINSHLNKVNVDINDLLHHYRHYFWLPEKADKGITN